MPWTKEQKKALLALSESGELSPRNCKGLGHSYQHCVLMLEMLREYSSLPKPKTYKLKGIKITICPPAKARGIYMRRKF